MSDGEFQIPDSDYTWMAEAAYREMMLERIEYPFEIGQIIKHNFVNFSFYRQGNFYYNIKYFYGSSNDPAEELYDTYQFSVPLDDIGTATLEDHSKALTFMRWIRRAYNNKTLVKL